MKKAKDYFAKYDEAIIQQYPDSIDAAHSLLEELMSEAVELQKLRKAKMPDSIVAIYKELNQKYNALIPLFEKKYGGSPLKRDGFKDVVLTITPAMKERWA